MSNIPAPECFCWRVADGRRLLQISATGSNVSARATARMDDATRARFDDTTQRDYFTLRRRIEIAEAQINGLQDYVRHICLTTVPRCWGKACQFNNPGQSVAEHNLLTSPGICWVFSFSGIPCQL